MTKVTQIVSDVAGTWTKGLYDPECVLLTSMLSDVIYSLISSDSVKKNV